MSWPRSAPVWLMLAALLDGASAAAQNDPEPAADAEESREPFASGRVRLFPSGDVYPPYLADPHRPTNAFTFQGHTRVGIHDSGGVRAWLAAGARFGLVRLGPREPEGRSWQLSFEAGLDAQYDSKRKHDNIGYDGIYGLVLTTADAGPLALKLGFLHTSSHVGDEYVDRTGRTRLAYTREELMLGAARRMGEGFRAYAETAVAYKLLNDELQRPWRVQGGIERAEPHAFARGRLGWYAAIDLQSWQERGWKLDRTLEGGAMVRSAARTVRLGLRYSKGRAPLGEFFRETEAWITVGLWLDI